MKMSAEEREQLSLHKEYNTHMKYANLATVPLEKTYFLTMANNIARWFKEPKKKDYKKYIQEEE